MVTPKCQIKIIFGSTFYKSSQFDTNTHTYICGDSWKHVNYDKNNIGKKNLTGSDPRTLHHLKYKSVRLYMLPIHGSNWEFILVKTVAKTIFFI